MSETKIQVPDHDQLRFWALVQKTDSCWNWLGGTYNGYGCFQVARKNFRAHRLAYMLTKGGIPEGKHLDHLCRNRSCVNPDHLEPVSQAENTARGGGVAACVVRTDLCSRGHSMQDAIVHSVTGKRWCRTCRYESYRRSRLKKHPESREYGQRDNS